MNPDAQYAELAWCQKDIARAEARLAENPHDIFAQRWLEMELAHRDRVQRYLASCGAGVRP
jgi:hypothetical protein